MSNVSLFFSSFLYLTFSAILNEFTIWIYLTHLFRLAFSLSFHFPSYNDIPFRKRRRDGDFSTRHSRRIPFPHLWFSSCGKKKFQHSRLRRSWWNFFSPRLLNHGVGNWDRPFVTHGEFSFPSLVASPLVREKSHPFFLSSLQ